MHLKKDYCIHGHKLLKNNVYIRPNGVIECRTCIRISGAKCRKTINRQTYMKKWNKSEKGKESQRKRESNRNKIFRSISSINNAFIQKSIKKKNFIKNNVCHDCKKSVIKNQIKYTQIHHIKYHYPPKLIDVVEVCIRCHINRHKKGEGKKIIR